MNPLFVFAGGSILAGMCALAFGKDKETPKTETKKEEKQPNIIHNHIYTSETANAPNILTPNDQAPNPGNKESKVKDISGARTPDEPIQQGESLSKGVDISQKSSENNKSDKENGDI